MPISVSSQAYVFMCSVIGGMLIAFIYDVFRVKRKAIKTNKIFTYIEDLVYWIIVALVMFASVYYSNDGEIRGFVFLGTLLGVVLYVLLLSRIIINSSLFIIGIVYKVVKTVCTIITYPIRIFLRLLSVPAKYFLKIFRNMFRSVKRTEKNRVAKAAMWKKIFRNVRKKI